MKNRIYESTVINNKEIVSMLNRVYCDEMLAHIQYWIGSKVSLGPMKDEIDYELMQHSKEELQHANLISTRILELGGELVIHPTDMLKYSTGGFSEPSDRYVGAILEQNLKGEKDAIITYKKIMDFTHNVDIKTYKMIAEIRNDEKKHRDDLRELIHDLERVVSTRGSYQH